MAECKCRTLDGRLSCGPALLDGKDYGCDCPCHARVPRPVGRMSEESITEQWINRIVAEKTASLAERVRVADAEVKTLRPEHSAAVLRFMKAESALAASEEKNAALRRIIEEAPHDDRKACGDFGYDPSARPPCTCWKAAAGRKET